MSGIKGFNRPGTLAEFALILIVNCVPSESINVCEKISMKQSERLAGWRVYRLLILMRLLRAWGLLYIWWIACCNSSMKKLLSIFSVNSSRSQWINENLIWDKTNKIPYTVKAERLPKCKPVADDRSTPSQKFSWKSVLISLSITLPWRQRSAIARRTVRPHTFAFGC